MLIEIRWNNIIHNTSMCNICTYTLIIGGETMKSLKERLEEWINDHDVEIVLSIRILLVILLITFVQYTMK